MEAQTTWPEVARLFMVTAIPIGGLLVAFLVYLRGHFTGLEKDRQIKVKELNENRELYIKMVVQNTMEGKLKEIHDMVAKLSSRIDELFGMLRK